MDTGDFVDGQKKKSKGTKREYQSTAEVRTQREKVTAPGKRYGTTGNQKKKGWEVLRSEKKGD